MRMERDLLGLLEGSWACGDGKGASHRREWLQRTRQAKTPEEVPAATPRRPLPDAPGCFGHRTRRPLSLKVKRSLLELEDAISWTAFLPEWRGATRGSSHRGYELDVPRSASERLPSALKSLPRERPVSAARTPAAADPNVRPQA